MFDQAVANILAIFCIGLKWNAHFPVSGLCCKENPKIIKGEVAFGKTQQNLENPSCKERPPGHPCLCAPGRWLF